jgi:hypothetical protein
MDPRARSKKMDSVRFLAKWHLIPNRIVAKGVQLRLLRQWVVMTAQKAQADVILRSPYYALPGWDATAERCDAQEAKMSSTAQPRHGDGLPATSMRTTTLASTE